MKLNQVLAVEKGTKSRVYGAVSELNKAIQKSALFNGFTKTYQKQEESGEDFPPERQIVQLKADDVLRKVATLFTELFDVTASKDLANCEAKADVKVGDVVIAADVPATYLLFLEKHLNDVHTFIGNLPVLDESDEWNKDDQSGLFKTPPIATHRTKKEQMPIVLYDATDKHPAQTQLITKDILIGYWNTIKLSGAIPSPRKEELLTRVETLLKAVKVAREEANSVDAPTVSVGDLVFRYLFA